MRRSLFALVLASAWFAACGSTRVPIDADPPDDAAIDTALPDTPEPIDAAVDAAVDAPAPLPGQEFNGAGGRVGGPTFTMDVQLGHPHGQQQLQGSTYRLEANTPIKP